MRVLYLLFNQQGSLTEFSNNTKISLSWVDAMLDELVKCDRISVGLAVPVNSNDFQKSQKNGITLYGLPNPENKSIFIKVYKRLIHSSEDTNANNFISRAVADFKPDIIQIFGSENFFGLIAREETTPVVIHIQGYLLVWQGKWFTGISRWNQFRYESLKNLLMMRGSFNDFVYFKKRAKTEETILKNCKYFMGRTDFDKRIAALLSPGSNYFHCEEFIRKNFFEKKWDFPLGDEIKCISIIKSTSYKGINLLIEALYVLKKYSDLSISLKVCGISQNDAIIKIIKKKYRKELSSVKIEFLGKVTSEDLVNQLCNSNFYLHPSYIENSPNSVCEAMALGMPVIATNVGGVSSLLENEMEGILVQEGEPYSLAGAIVELTINYEKAKQLGRNARIKAHKRHNPDDILKSLLNIYDKITYENGRKELS
jgi:glycosyltransferase involved in cell wall biosynthesis